MSETREQRLRRLRIERLQAERGGQTAAAPSAAAESAMPPDMVFNPNTGQYTSRELLANAMEMNRAEAGAAGAAQGMTFGLSDEALGGMNAIIPGAGTMRERYDFGREASRAQLDAARGQFPVTSLAGEVGGAVTMPFAAASRAGSLLGRVGRGMGMGGLLGGAYGFGAGEGGAGERVENARDVGLLSAAIGGAIPVAGALVQRAGRWVAERGAARRMAEAAPSVDALKAQAGRLYEAAERNGVTAAQDQTRSLAGTMRGIATEEGLVSPTGRIAESFPKVRDALNMVDDYAQGTMTPTQMQSVRRTLQAAAGSADGSERRIGTMMLREFDNFVEPLAPEFRQANALYARAMKGDMIDEAIELAGVRAGQFSGSGFENALRTEFRALARKIAKGQLRGLSPDEVAAIQRVANGGAVENVLRDIGKAAPRGVVSTGVATSVPFMVGNAAGGPALGGLLAAGTLGAGEIGRRAATAMQTRNAQVAGGLMRSGGQMPSLPGYGAATRGLLESALLRADPTLSATLQRP